MKKYKVLTSDNNQTVYADWVEEGTLTLNFYVEGPESTDDEVVASFNGWRSYIVADQQFEAERAYEAAKEKKL